MLYIIYATDIINSQNKFLSIKYAHLMRLQLLKDEGRLLTAGQTPAVDSNDPGMAGFTGLIIVAKFESLNDALAWVKEDPYITKDIFNSISVKPYKKFDNLS